MENNIPRFMTVFGLGWMLLTASVASAQSGFDPPPSFPSFAAPIPAPRAVVAAPATRPVIAPVQQVAPPAAIVPGLPKRVQNVVDFYGAGTSNRTLAQIPQRPSTGATSVSRPAASYPSRPTRLNKPFRGVGDSPTLSPYLNLFREENNEYLPNYHAYVRPHRQQQEGARRQQVELSRLQRQVQTVSYNSTSGSNQGTPSTGHGTRFSNTAGYFPPIGVRR